MRIIGATVAVVAAAVMISSLSNPALAAGKKSGGDNFFGKSNPITEFFKGFQDNNDRGRGYGGGYGGGSGGGWHPGGGNGGGGGGGKGKGQRTFFDNPGSPATEGTSPTNTIVYFGTCLNLAGFSQGGNAGPDGFCLPYESLVGNEGNPGSPGSGASCTITTTSKSGGGGGYPTTSARGSGGSEGGYGQPSSSSETVSGTCAAYQAANPPPNKPGHDWNDDEDDYEGVPL